MSETAEEKGLRVDSIDLLRGLVIVIMLLDHTREFLHADAFRFSPTDLTKTSLALFFTRWITHFCAPVFVFLAGTSVRLQRANGKSASELSLFLLKRGLWLILLEFTLIRFGIFFNFDYRFLGLASVIWAIGVSMLVLAAFVRLPIGAAAIFGVALIALHNLLDSIRVQPAVAMANQPTPDALQKLWLVLHQPGFFPLFGESLKVFVAYPLIPWIGVITAGYAFGTIYVWDAARRQRFFLRFGAALLALFVVLRAANVYGDPQIWKPQANLAFTVLSFLNTTKYPVSLLFLLMTLAPAILFLRLTDDARATDLVSRVLIVFGRVPLFFYLMQWFVAHGLAVLSSVLAKKPIAHLFLNFPASATNVAPEAGFDLPIVYAAWLGGLIILYPLCLWWGKVKRRRRGFPFSYL